MKLSEMCKDALVATHALELSLGRRLTDADFNRTLQSLLDEIAGRHVRMQRQEMAK